MAQSYTNGDEPVPGSGYRLVEFLGRGGFGEVWKATAPGGTEVAVKILNLAGVQGRKEFRALQLVKRIRHPNLVPFTAFWLKAADGTVIDDAQTAEPDGWAETSADPSPMKDTMVAPADVGRPQATELVIVMGLGDKSLFDRLMECVQEGRDGIPDDELLDYTEDAARAIDYLNSPIHDLGSGLAAIQHCDIKPHNIMIVGGATQVCDFGLARMMGADRTTSAAATIAYAAPECLQDGVPSDTTDQYSLAISYYELKTGALPYAEETAGAVIKAKAEGKLDFSRVSEAEQAVLRRATACEPDKRYPSCMDMARELRVAVEGGPVTLPYAGTARRGNRLIVMFLLLIVLGGVGYGGWLVFRPEPDGENGHTNGEGGTNGPPVVPIPPPDRLAEALRRAADLEGRGELREATEAYTDALRIDRDNADAFAGRGRLYVKLNEPDLAISDLEQAKTLDPGRRGLDAELADLYLARGTGRLEAGELDDAIADLSRAAEHNPDDGRIFSRRGAARFMQNDFTGAVEDFTTAIELDRADSDYVRRGRAYQKLDKADEAAADFREAARQNPDNVEARFYLADLDLRQGEAPEAITVLTEAIEAAGRTSKPSIPLADLYGQRGSAHLSAEEFQKGADDLTQALRLEPGSPASLHEARADCFEAVGRVRAGQYDRLLAGCFGQLADDPANHEAHNEVAYYLAVSPEPEIRDGRAALAHAERACELTDHKEPEYLDTLAAAHAELGDFSQAREWQQKAVDLAPDEEARKRFQTRLELYESNQPFRDETVVEP